MELLCEQIHPAKTVEACASKSPRVFVCGTCLAKFSCFSFVCKMHLLELRVQVVDFLYISVVSIAQLHPSQFGNCSQKQQDRCCHCSEEHVFRYF